MTIEIDDVCTDADLDEFLGGQLSAGQHLMPKAWASAEPARQYALDRIMAALARRTPPIREADLADKTELKMAVLFGASEHLNMLSASSGTDAELFAFKAKEFGKRFDAEINGLTPTLVGGVRGNTYSFAISRR